MSWKDLLKEVKLETKVVSDDFDSSFPPAASFLKPFSLQHLALAEKHYQTKGYALKCVPWVVSKAPYYATKPSFALPYETRGGFLTASAEQAFLQLMLQGVSLTKAYAFGPCFRVEAHDEFHLPYFFKLELINTHAKLESLEEMVFDAKEFFDQFITCEVVLTNEGGLDIVSKSSGIELGSYGLRELCFKTEVFSWVYGTGLAEPRFTQALQKTLDKA